MTTTLKTTTENFCFLGHVKLPRNPLREPSDMTAQWLRYSYSIGVVINENNCPYAKIEYMVNSKPKDENDPNGANPKVVRYLLEKADPNDSSKKVYVTQDFPFENRLDHDVLNQVADFTKKTVAIERDEAGNLIQRTFVREKDMVDYLMTHLTNDMRVKVFGRTKYRRYKNKKTNEISVSKNREIMSIKLVDEVDADNEPIQNSAISTVHFYFDASSLDDSAIDTDHVLYINAHQVQYYGKDSEGNKLNDVIPVQYLIDFDSLNIDLQTKEGMFFRNFMEELFKCPSDTVKQGYWTYYVEEGNEKVSEETTVDAELMQKFEMLKKMGVYTDKDIENMTRNSQGIGDRFSKSYLFKPASLEADGVIVEDVTPETAFVQLDLSNGIDKVNGKATVSTEAKQGADSMLDKMGDLFANVAPK